MLYIHNVDQLIRSPTKLKFSFYDFFMIFKDSVKINKKEKDKTTLQNHSRVLFDRF